MGLEPILSRSVDGSCEVSVGKVVRFFHGPGKALNFGPAPHSPRVSGPSLFSLPLASPRTSAVLFDVLEKRKTEERREGERRKEGGREASRTKVFDAVQADKAQSGVVEYFNIYHEMKLERGGYVYCSIEREGGRYL